MLKTLMAAAMVALFSLGAISIGNACPMGGHKQQSAETDTGKPAQTPIPSSKGKSS